MKNTKYTSGVFIGRLMLTGKSFLYKKNQRYIEVYCYCGNVKFIRVDALKSGKSKSCGCGKINSGNYKNGNCIKKTTKEKFVKKIYNDILRRCNEPKCKDYKNYGGRGIKVCEEWLHNFNCFYEWYVNNQKEGDDSFTIDRVNNSLGYSPQNCRFATDFEQRRNKRNNVFFTIFNETKVMTDWGKDKRCAVSSSTFKQRLRYGWSPEYALTTEKQNTRRLSSLARLK